MFTNAKRGRTVLKLNQSRLPLTEHPNALPASRRCPGQLKDAVWRVCFTQHVRFAFGHGRDRPNIPRDARTRSFRLRYFLEESDGRGTALDHNRQGVLENRFERHSKILVIRLRQPTEAKIHERTMLALANFPSHDWPGLAVVMRDQTQNITRF